jgi:hypothetical protein
MPGTLMSNRQGEFDLTNTRIALSKAEIRSRSCRQAASMGRTIQRRARDESGRERNLGALPFVTTTSTAAEIRLLAVSFQIGSYPEAAKKLAHSVGVKSDRSWPILFQRPSTVRSAALRSRAFSLEKAFSIGLKSGL